MRLDGFRADHEFADKNLRMIVDGVRDQIECDNVGFKDKYGCPPKEIGIIAFEWEPPHDCALLILDQDDIALGLEKREEAFRRIAECQASGIWPSYGRQSFRPESIRTA